MKEEKEILINKKNLWNKIWNARYLYLLILPFIVWMVIFQYGPMYGVILAFKDFKAPLGILGSPWVGLEHFEKIFSSRVAISSIANTLRISISRLIFEFPMGIIVAILLAEMPGKRVKKVYQTILTFPHFLSWIVVSAILVNLLSDHGAVNSILELIGIEKISFLGERKLFRPLLYITSNWKEMGWGAIIYIASIAGVDPSLYEAAEIDGASRLRRIWHITLPGIRPTIAVSFILAVGGILNAGFDQIFNMKNDVVADMARILDTYIYDLTFTGVPDYGFTTAVGLFKAIINFFLLLLANKAIHLMTGQKMFQ